MVTLHPEFVVDEARRTKALILPYPEWEKLMEELEELEDIRSYDKAKPASDETILFDQAVREIREDHDE